MAKAGLLALLVAVADAAPGMLLMEHHPSVVHPAQASVLADADVASAFARVMDLPVPRDTHGVLPAGDIFRRPSAAVMVNIEALAPLTVGELELPTLQALLSDAHAYPLEGDGSLRDLVGSSAGASLADSLSARYNDRPLVLCVSSGEGAADACGGAGHNTISLAPQALELRGFDGQALAAPDLNDTAASPLWGQFRSRGGRFAVRGGVATVSLGDTVATFDMEADADRALLSELELFAQLPQILAQAPGTAGKLEDDVPDMMLLSASGLQALATQHGAESAEYAMAAALLDSALAELRQELAQMPWEEPMWAVVLHDPVHRVQQSSGRRQLLAAAQAVAAPVRAGPRPPGVLAERVPAFGSKEQGWQIQVWTFVGMVLAVFYASSFLFYTDYGKDDAGLYSKYKPKDSWGSESKM